jgi:coenzyme F420-dependent glucose-6-phosphate dehydrogenase
MSKTSIYWFCGHEQFQPEVIVKQAQAVEKAGFDGIMVSEHLSPWVTDFGANGFALSTLGAIAASTSKVKLMTAVLTPLFRYHPAMIAQAAATIDRLSGGRFELGIGTGENINEAPLGYNFSSYKERSDRIKEAIEIMRRLLDGEKIDYEGAYYKVDSFKLYSPPISHVPIIMAAGGPQSARLAGRNCDGLMVSVKDIDQAEENAITPAKSVSKPNFRIVANHWTIFADNKDSAWEAIKPWRGLRAPNRLESTNPAELEAAADKMDRDDIIKQYDLVGSTDEFFNAYKPLITVLGADSIGIQTSSTDQIATIELMGREVLPKLRSLNKET